MQKLSISRAWDEARAVLSRDGRLFATVALALLVLPSAIAAFVYPSEGMTPVAPTAGSILLFIVVTLIGVVGQLAMIRLAIGPSISVGDAIAHGARRALPYIAAGILILVGLILVSLPFVLALVALGVPLEPGVNPPPAAWLLFLLYVILIFYVALRMLMTSPVASAEAVGPIAILRRSLQLTSGHVLRLLGFLLLFLIAAIIAITAITLLASLLVTLLGGSVEPLTVGALVLALVEAVLGAVATTILIVMLARMYLQLTGGAVETSVPASGV